MALGHAADPSATAQSYVEALAAVCDHYGVEAESKYVELPAPASRVHYLTAGEGPSLLLLHGLGAAANVWIPLFDAVTDHFTVYAPDRPGRGLSTPLNYRETGFREFGVEYLVSFLDSLGIEETAVMGNSLGGFQSLALSIDHPDRVTCQCLVGAPAGLSRTIPTFLRLFDLPVVGRWLFDHFEAETVADARKQYRQIDVVDDSALPAVYFRPELVGESLPGQRESLVSLMETLGTYRGIRPQFDLRGALPSVETPTRFVWGTEDYFWPPDVGRRWIGSMPDADLVVLPDHGHMPWLEPNDDATEAAVAFLTEMAETEAEI